eukprot:jgi/Bigna1/67200/fgenesh1_pg.3_\
MDLLGALTALVFGVKDSDPSHDKFEWAGDILAMMPKSSTWLGTNVGGLWLLVVVQMEDLIRDVHQNRRTTSSSGKLALAASTLTAATVCSVRCVVAWVSASGTWPWIGRHTIEGQRIARWKEENVLTATAAHRDTHAYAASACTTYATSSCSKDKRSSVSTVVIHVSVGAMQPKIYVHERRRSLQSSSIQCSSLILPLLPSPLFPRPSLRVACYRGPLNPHDFRCTPLGAAGEGDVRCRLSSKKRARRRGKGRGTGVESRRRMSSNLLIEEEDATTAARGTDPTCAYHKCLWRETQDGHGVCDWSSNNFLYIPRQSGDPLLPSHEPESVVMSLSPHPPLPYNGIGVEQLRDISDTILAVASSTARPHLRSVLERLCTGAETTIRDRDINELAEITKAALLNHINRNKFFAQIPRAMQQAIFTQQWPGYESSISAPFLELRGITEEGFRRSMKKKKKTANNELPSLLPPSLLLNSSSPSLKDHLLTAALIRHLNDEDSVYNRWRRTRRRRRGKREYWPQYYEIVTNTSLARHGADVSHHKHTSDSFIQELEESLRSRPPPPTPQQERNHPMMMIKKIPHRKSSLSSSSSSPSSKARIKKTKKKKKERKEGRVAHAVSTAFSQYCDKSEKYNSIKVKRRRQRQQQQRTKKGAHVATNEAACRRTTPVRGGGGLPVDNSRKNDWRGEILTTMLVSNKKKRKKKKGLGGGGGGGGEHEEEEKEEEREGCGQHEEEEETKDRYQDMDTGMFGKVFGDGSSRLLSSDKNSTMAVFPAPPPYSDGSIEELLSWLDCTRRISEQQQQQQQKNRKKRGNLTGIDGELCEEGDELSTTSSDGDSSLNRRGPGTSYWRKFFTSRIGYGDIHNDPADDQELAGRSQFAEKGEIYGSNEGSSGSAAGEIVRLILTEVENEEIRANEDMIAAAYRLSGL